MSIEGVTSIKRMELFSDAVFAIIITLMVLEIKIPSINDAAASQSLWPQLVPMLPHLIAYLLSFVILGIMWINHHHFFNYLKYADPKFLWYNLHLLFWISLIPVPTAFLGEHYKRPEAAALYGFVLFMTTIAWMLMQYHAQYKVNLFVDVANAGFNVYKKLQVLTAILYFISIFAGYLSVFISYGIFVFLLAIYFLPKRIMTITPLANSE